MHETDLAIARALPDLVAIIGGHDQILLAPYHKVGNVPIFQAFEKGRYLGRIGLIIDPVSKRAKIASGTYIPITSDIEPDPQIAGIVEKYYNQLDDKFGEMIGIAEKFLGCIYWKNPF